MTKTATILPYDRSLQTEGLVVDQSENFFRLITPRLGRWRLLSVGWFIGIGVLAFYAFVPIIAALAMKRADRIGAMATSAPYAFVLAIVVFAAISKLNRRYIFEIAYDSFTIKFTQLARATRVSVYRRSAVTDIHAGVERGQLIIHVRGHDMLDLQISPDRDLAERIARALNAGMSIKMLPTSQSDADTSLAGAGDAAVGRRRTILLSTTLAIIVIGAVLAIVIHPIVLWPVMFIASVLTGLAMGTQKKEYYFF